MESRPQATGLSVAGLFAGIGGIEVGLHQGRTPGISGENSGLVREVLRLASGSDVRWLLLENVPFMLLLERGGAMRFLTRSLEEIEFTWAYRVVDTRAFGLPQRRQRVILLASRTEDPRAILFAGDEGEPAPPDDISAAFLRKLKGVGRRPVRIPEGVVGSRVPTPSLDLPADWGLASPSARASGQVSLTVPPWPTVAAPGLSSAWTAANGESGER